MTGANTQAALLRRKMSLERKNTQENVRLHHLQRDPGNLSDCADETYDWGRDMKLSALLVCVDETASAVLRKVLEELRIQVEGCPDFARAAIRTAQQRFDVVIVDAGSNADTLALLRETRMSRLNDSTLAVAVVPTQESVRELFSLGVNFVLYKPVAHDRALTSLRAARALMRKDKRKNPRASVHTHAIVDYANVAQENATLVDLAKDGMAVRFGKKIPLSSKVYFQFKLPGQTSNVRLSGQIVWQDWNGIGGVQFADVPKTSRKLIDEFLASNIPSENPSEIADVPVEMEEIVAPMSMVMPEHFPSNHGSSAEPIPHTHGASAPSVEENSDPNNRRTKTRYSCRVGAEVYLTGTPVPNHCCISDLSSGGCYLEVSLPFPTGSSVEIIVRTYEMKLNLRGVVQASHPGYGMGVAFELKTKEEQDNVKKLTEFVVATAAATTN
jgi:DNA-binding response OmpR family regulator